MNECRGIQDIYYYPKGYKTPEYFAENVECAYTLNPISKDLPTIYIKRKFYDDYKKEYESYGLVFPYPRRTGWYGVQNISFSK